MYTANLFTLNEIPTLANVPAIATATYAMDATDRIFVSVTNMDAKSRPYSCLVSKI